MLFLWLVLLFRGAVCTVNPMSQNREDLFSATSKLAVLMTNEEQVVQVLEKYVLTAEQRIAEMKTYVNSYRWLMDSGRSVDQLVAHPVDAYLLIKRLTVDWERIEEAVNKEANQTSQLLHQVLGFRENTEFPVLDDLHGAGLSLVRLQDTYQLDLSSLTGGELTGIGEETTVFQSVQKLSARDCLFLGKHAFNRGYYARAVSWFEVAYDKTLEEGNMTTSLEEIKPFLDTAMRVHDDILEKRGPRGLDWRTNPVPMDPELAQNQKYDAGLTRSTFVPKLYQFQTQEEESDHMERLCRGENLRPESLASTLKCRYIHNDNPALILGPLKLEEHSLDPYIVVFHEFLTAAETHRFTDIAGPLLQTSRYKGKDGQLVKGIIRTSKTAWLTDRHEPKMIPAITQRIETATGLKCQEQSSAEEYQVANYGIGGLYVTHTDYFRQNPEESGSTDWENYIGDRISTFMVYLTDVEAGGATVFPRAGVTLWPKRGSAAFWWNLYKNGFGDENTRHAGCPVLHGSKWISNKWPHMYDQMFNAQCGIHPLDKFKTP